MSVLFGLYQPEGGIIKKNGEVVKHQRPQRRQRSRTSAWCTSISSWWSASPCWTTSFWAWSPARAGFLQKKEAREKVVALSEKYGLMVDPDAKVEDITVGMQQRTEILKMLYRENEILIFDEPTAVLTPQEIDELMQIMRNLRPRASRSSSSPTSSTRSWRWPTAAPSCARASASAP
jgi:ABC-type uncharacterized transport system ATPase subunit